MKSALFLSALVGAAIAASSSAQLGGVPKRLWAKFHNGVNITRWFCYLDTSKDGIEHFKSYMLPEDYENFRNLKVDFVRLCVSPEAIYDNGKPNAANLPYLDKAIEELTKHHLAVLLDLHDNGQLKLDDPKHDNSGFVTFWSELASHYKGAYRDSVVFELLNEPVFTDTPKVWFDLQSEAVKAVRQADPTRTIMVSGTRWSGIDALADLTPLPEQNLIYTFHCYDPFYFTHQGASWVGAQPRDFKNVPFPSSPLAVAGILGDNSEANQAALKDYGEHRYDDIYLRNRIQAGADYGKAHNVLVLLGEFGAYPLVSPPESRARWFEAMRAAVTQAHVPYCIWGYDDALGLGRSVESGHVRLDPVTTKAFYGL